MLTELIVSLVVVAAFIGIYYATTGILPGATLIEQELPTGASGGLNAGEANLMFFYTTWCPYCHKAQDAWRSLEQLVKNNRYRYGGNIVTFEQINAESNKGKAALYNIKAYPTFKIETPTKLYEMVGAPTVSNFRTFLTKALGSEKSSS